MNLKNLGRYYHTVKYLKPVQIYFRLYYQILKILGRQFPRLSDKKAYRIGFLKVYEDLTKARSCEDPVTFKFLNKGINFSTGIDWNFDQNGKLWLYHLNYFDFLLQEEMTKEVGLVIMTDFQENYGHILDGRESYPTSLRMINWIKFISKYKIAESRLHSIVFSDTQRLSRRPEYHLLGNHLLENGFALLFAAYFFHDQKLLSQALGILQPQLKEQILSDGAHFELSPMYHLMVLTRLLEVIDLMENNDYWNLSAFVSYCRSLAESMLGWIEAVIFRNGTLPQVNDCALDGTVDLNQLRKFAMKLGLTAQNQTLSDCGYRKIDFPSYEVVIDVGNIGPDYLPGHAHCDSLQFLLHIDKKPFVVDTGTSTYDPGCRRQIERSTSSHNTVMINASEQSEIWSVFRVGNRARVTISHDTMGKLVARHDGYQKFGITHQRVFETNPDYLRICDRLNRPALAKSFLHFYPDVKATLIENKLETDLALITISGADQCELLEYDYCQGFGKTEKALVLVSTFKQELQTNIDIT